MVECCDRVDAFTGTGALPFGVAVLALALLMPASGHAQTLFPGQSWFGQGREGWFWYQDPPPEPELQPASLPPPGPPPPPSVQSPPADRPAPPPVLSTAWFRANLDRYKDAAIDSPTPENVERYLVLQRLMMDRASRFTDMFQRVVASTPYLDANTERPLDSVAANATNEIAASATDALLRTLAGSVGLVFFFRSDCAICATQVEILQAATHLYGFTVLYVSLDGKPMTDMAMPAWQMPAWTPNAGQAERMGITSAPALAVMRPPSEFGLLAKTVLSLPTLSERVLLQARAAGWISEDDYAATRPVKDHPLQVAADAVSDATVADAEKFLAFIHGLKEAQP